VKCKKWWKARSFFLEARPPLQSGHPIIDKVSLSYNLMEHYYVSPILPKRYSKNAVKALVMLVVQSPKKLPMFIAEIP
jgi:hypothetical protein